MWFSTIKPYIGSGIRDTANVTLDQQWQLIHELLIGATVDDLERHLYVITVRIRHFSILKSDTVQHTSTVTETI